MKDPIEIEVEATEWLELGTRLIGCFIYAVFIVALAAGLLGAAIGLVIRAAKWAMGY